MCAIRKLAELTFSVCVGGGGDGGKYTCHNGCWYLYQRELILDNELIDPVGMDAYSEKQLLLTVYCSVMNFKFRGSEGVCLRKVLM